MGIAVVLSVAGTDSGGGAGLVADVKTFQAHGVWGTVAVTAVTVQDTTGVHAVKAMPADLVAAQIFRVRADLQPVAAKTGMLASEAIAVAAAEALRGMPLVVDPVLTASHGQALFASAASVLAGVLVPMATVITPNLDEAGALIDGEVRDRKTMEEAGRELVGRGAKAALVTGGHLADDRAADCLVRAGEDPIWIDGPRHEQPNAHGSGCVLSAAITANVARGDDIETACRKAKRWTAGAIAAGLPIGHGTGPVDPSWAPTAS